MTDTIRGIPMTRAEYDRLCAHLKQENARWGLHMEPVPEIHWLASNPLPIAVFRSSAFIAQVFAPANGGQRISVCRTSITREGDWREDISWEELMSVKADCGFVDRWAVEIFPPDANVVNVANLRHLWITDKPLFAWS